MKLDGLALQQSFWCQHCGEWSGTKGLIARIDPWPYLRVTCPNCGLEHVEAVE